MRLIDYLGAFSIEDLRELATRRRVLISPAVLRDRQTLLRNLASTLGQYDNLYGTVTRLNEAELGALAYILKAGRQAGLSGLCAAVGARPDEAKTVLDSLRLWGLVFPEGNWEQIAIPGATQLASNYINSRNAKKRAEPVAFTPPQLRLVEGVQCEARPSSLAWDVAELLARVARSRMKLTQAGRMNRRDLRAMDPAFAVPEPGYSAFLYLLAADLRLLTGSRDGILAVSTHADAWLGQAETVRAEHALSAWQQLRGYPESVAGDPAESDYLPLLLNTQRARSVEILRDLRDDQVATVASVGRRLEWTAPWAFQQWDSNRNATDVGARLVRSLYWQGLLAVDDASTPKHVRLTPLGRRLLSSDARAEGPALIPEEPQFFLQPNAEVFAPPNLAPRTLFHLRRITGEKKGGPAGMYPLTADSVRRALDTRLTSAEILAFLERYSRTGLPANVAALVETAGRQHGRIRIVPAGYVLVADDPSLLKELLALKPVAPLLGRELTERAATVEGPNVAELMRTLRGRGYAPLNEADASTGPGLPDDPAAPVPPLEAPRAGQAAPELNWDAVEGPLPEAPGAMSQAEIQKLLEHARDEGLAVEIEYQGREDDYPIARTIWPYNVNESIVDAHCCLRQDDRHFRLSRIAAARLTGESFDREL